MDFYYSVPDWHYPDFPAQYSQSKFHGDPNPNADLEKYVTYVKGQLRELLTQYGPVGILWFDDGGSFGGISPTNRAAMIHAQEILDEIHELQPNCIVNNRLGLPADYGTPEQHIPGGKSTNAFEVCMTLNNHWGYNKADQNWKSSTVVIRNLVDIASKGGNYLLNVGPTSQGTFPPPAIKILGEVGSWMKANGDSIYGTTASPFAQQPSWGRFTQKGNKLYLHVFDWPQDGKLFVPGLKNEIASARLVANGQGKLPVSNGNGGVTITVPADAPDKISSTIVLQINGAPEIGE
jgi:alpha-L-fucosidase